MRGFDGPRSSRAAFILVLVFLPINLFATGPTISSLSPTSGAVGASVTIAGSGFGSSQGTSRVTFNGTTASTISSWTSGQIIALVPTGASTGNVVVTVSGKASNGILFSVLPAPVVSSVSPSSTPCYSNVTVSGSNFGTTPGAVGFNGNWVTPTSWSDTSVVAQVPCATLASGNLAVYASGVDSNSVNLTVWPQLQGVSPQAGSVGSSVTVSGWNFGNTQGSSTVSFNGISAVSITSWSATSIVALVPPGATTGNVVVTANGESSSQAVPFTVFSGTPTSVVYHLHQEAGPVSGTYLLSPNAPDAASTYFQSPNLKGLSNGTAATFTAQVPGIIPYSTVISFSVWMAATSSVSGLVPQLYIDDGLVVYSCVNHGSTALTTTPTKYQFTCSNPSAGIFNQGQPLYFYAGAWYQPGGTIKTSVQVLVYLEGTLSGNYDSQVTIPEVLAPAINSVTPSSGGVGASVSIGGSHFNSSQGSSVVTFNGATANPTSWSDSTILVPVPSGATTGNVVVANGVSSNGVTFTVLPSPTISGLSPNSGPAGTAVTISGSNFGSSPGTVTFNGVIAPITNWNTGSIVTQVPNGATSGYVVVTVNGVSSNGAFFSVAQIPGITALSPTTGPVGDSVTISGMNFGATQGTSTVTFNGTLSTPTNWSATSVVVPVPSGATSGNVIVTVAGWPSNGISFTVVPTPGITSLSPNSGPVGTLVTISGTNFGASQGNSTVTFNGTSAIPTNWSTTSISVPVPNGATTGNVVVSVNGVSSNAVLFTVLPTPNINSLSPTSGAVSTPITIAGMNFGTTQNTSTITFNGATATSTSWSTNSITAPVPNAATSGNVVVTVNGVASNGVYFTVTSSTATLVSISVNPASATMDIGNTQAYSAIGTYSDGSTQDVTASSAWTSSLASVAAVDSTGLVTTVDQGQTTIQASTGGISGATTLTVTNDFTITPAYQSQYASTDVAPKQIAIGSDGFARFVVWDWDGQSRLITYVRCLDLDCATSNTQQVNTHLGNVPGEMSITVGPDGFARIAYTGWDGTGCQGPLNLIQCSNDDCSSSTTTLVDTGGPNLVASVGTGNDGTSYILYDNQPDGYTCSVGPTNINLASCTSGGACSTMQIDQFDNGDDILGGALTMAPDGNPAVAYTDILANGVGPSNSVYYYHNGGRSLTSTDVGDSIIDLAVAPDGSGRILFPNTTAAGLNFANCADASCTSSQISTVSPSGYLDGYVSGAVDADGNAHMVVSLDTSPVTLDYIQCSSTNCSSYRTEGLGETWEVGASLALDSDGLPHILAQASTPPSSPQVVEHVHRELSATLKLNSAQNQQVSATDAAATLYKGFVGTLNLGTMAGTLGVNNACVAGNELDAKVSPSTSTGPVTIKRFVTSITCWEGSNPATNPNAKDVCTPGDDNDTDLFTTDPQENTPEGSANGHVFDLDAPGVFDPPASIPIRIRVNFKAYAVGPDGKTKISPDLDYFVRLSCQNNSSGIAQFVSDVQGDNQIGVGTTKTTWNLQ